MSDTPENEVTENTQENTAERPRRTLTLGGSKAAPVEAEQPAEDEVIQRAYLGTRRAAG